MRAIWNRIKHNTYLLARKYLGSYSRRSVGPRDKSGVQREVDALYRHLYHAVHDLEQSLDLAATSTKASFGHQWETMKEGRFLLSDPWFRDNVAHILTEEEIQIKPEWFKGKHVLDAGCGNGRWSYGFAQLGADITAVDINEAAIEETSRAIAEFPANKRFFIERLENLSDSLGDEKFDLVFCWGVIHHAKSFNESLRQLLNLVKPQGIFYTYLYGRESMTLDDDIELFKERVYYNSLSTESERMAFLMEKAHGDRTQVHNQHDIYAPLINRRLDYSYVENFIRTAGFEDVVRTIDHTELFVRAIKDNAADYEMNWLLPKRVPPYWFQRLL